MENFLNFHAAKLLFWNAYIFLLFMSASSPSPSSPHHSERTHHNSHSSVRSSTHPTNTAHTSTTTGTKSMSHSNNSSTSGSHSPRQFAPALVLGNIRASVGAAERNDRGELQHKKYVGEETKHTTQPSTQSDQHPLVSRNNGGGDTSTTTTTPTFLSSSASPARITAVTAAASSKAEPAVTTAPPTVSAIQQQQQQQNKIEASVPQSGTAAEQLEGHNDKAAAAQMSHTAQSTEEYRNAEANEHHDDASPSSGPGNKTADEHSDTPLQLPPNTEGVTLTTSQSSSVSPMAEPAAMALTPPNQSSQLDQPLHHSNHIDHRTDARAQPVESNPPSVSTNASITESLCEPQKQHPEENHDRVVAGVSRCPTQHKGSARGEM